MWISTYVRFFRKMFAAVLYYVENENVEDKSMAVISDDLRYNAVSVYTYQTFLLEYIKIEFSQKIYNCTDRPAEHFKSKSNFSNLLDFAIEAEWHFHTTAGGNLKKQAARYSLHGSLNQHILNAKDL